MLVTVLQRSCTVVEVSCDGRAGCKAAFIAIQPGEFNRESAQELARSIGKWVFLGEQALCANCAADTQHTGSNAAPWPLKSRAVSHD
jgi:hypothetical protein